MKQHEEMEKHVVPFGTGSQHYIVPKEIANTNGLCETPMDCVNAGHANWANLL